MNKKINFSIKKSLYSQLLFIDGLNRSGKSIFSGLLSQFENTEQIKFKMIFEHLFPSYILGKIDKYTCKSIISAQLNEISYNSMIARDVNFRKNDQSSIYNHIDFNMYLDRARKKENLDKNIEVLKSGKIIFPYQTHDILVYLDKIKKLNLNFKIIEIFRNPFDNLYSWFKEDLHNRFSNDPRVYTLSFKYRLNEYPWYFAMNKKFLELDKDINNKTIFIFIHLLKNSLKNAKKFNGSNLHIIFFDDLIINPDKELLEISLFLNKKFKKNKNKYFEANIPRSINLKEQNKKKEYIRKICDKDLFNELQKLEHEYINEKYNLKN